jgi:hypothetical protein
MLLLQVVYFILTAKKEKESMRSALVDLISFYLLSQSVFPKKSIKYHIPNGAKINKFILSQQQPQHKPSQPWCVFI